MHGNPEFHVDSNSDYHRIIVVWSVATVSNNTSMQTNYVGFLKLE